MKIIEIYGKQYEPALFIVDTSFNKKDLYTYTKDLGFIKRNDMNLTQFENHCKQMRREGLTVKEVTKEFSTDILEN